ncbi:isoprenyl transferase [Lactobacillus sp. DCY120]|uniref:Isoprenyl transferase n=1 Tax=Bombilactobacillus apium TaxID=2675299 RepID=A0A850RCK4_9LACO|nr:isoprenyl transferase [Bombilactobacillus apium]NVY97026.1 isoprenyl transferase [Bombilactobacillus apium]
MVKMNVPQHVAIIMDGNGRWAQQRGLPRIAGHRAGMNNLQTIAQTASDLGIKALSVYAFSTENWTRPSKEVRFLMNLPIDFFGTFMPRLMKNQTRVTITGDLTTLPSKTRQVCERAIDQTRNNTGLILNFAFNYGARKDLLQAIRHLGQDYQSQGKDWSDLDEATFSQYLQTAQLGFLQNPDLLIRTSGEERLSNFYLWELAYAELVFSSEYWPDYSPANLKRDLEIFNHRQRRFGGLEQTEK